jgi:hypothetical protein
LTLLAVLGVAVGLPPSAGARTKTTATIFQAFTSTGTPTIPTRSKSGYCYTGSLTINRADAWRCFVGNYLYDPCFSSSQAHGVVICPNLQVNGGIQIRLTKPFPQGQANAGTPSLSEEPWNIQLTTGKHFAFSSGATNVVHGVRLNYFCGAGCNYGLWGYPRRRSQPWTILIGSFNATTLHDRRPIRHVWM